MTNDPKAKQASPPQMPKPPIDCVEEASQESFPASDAPSWTVSTGEKGTNTAQNPREPKAAKRGAALSFVMQERGEIDPAAQPDPKSEYVQPEKEKEAGGEG